MMSGPRNELRDAAVPAGTTRGPARDRARGASRNRSSASASCFRYVRFRWTRRSKSTSWASNSGPSTQANWAPCVVSTRQPPHMPVPSTISEFRLTTVLIACGRVVSATACIIRGGPMASTRSIFRPDVDQRLELVGHEALAAVAAVVGGDEQLVADGADLLLEDHQLLVPAAHDRDHVVAGLLHGLGGRVGDGRADAAADHHDRAVKLDLRRLAQRPTRSRIASPASSMLSSLVVLPMPWTMIVIVPLLRDRESAIVRGIRSPWACSRRITN